MAVNAHWYDPRIGAAPDLQLGGPNYITGVWGAEPLVKGSEGLRSSEADEIFYYIQCNTIQLNTYIAL